MNALQAFELLNIEASSERAALFERFADLFLEYNSHTNLSAIRDRDGVLTKHFADSAVIARFADLSGKRILDIGTGGGFPGIPLKILLGDAEVVLLDSVSKKTKACDHFVRELGLSNISSVWGRAEDVAKDVRYAHGFDAVVSRATAFMPDILAWATPFLRPNGRIYLYKTPSEEEREAGNAVLKKLWLMLESEHLYAFEGMRRSIFEFRFKNTADNEKK